MTATILLVEDTLDLAHVIQRELENEGYHVLHTASGKQALAYQERERPNLLILLMHSPGRTYLLEAVWGGSYITGDRSVDNAILRMRKNRLDQYRHIGRPGVLCDHRGCMVIAAAPDRPPAVRAIASAPGNKLCTSVIPL